MKKIFRRFNIVDYLALSSGLGLTLAYLLFKNYFDENSPIIDVWPNIATEILGIWISVRVIDELIQRREKKKGKRGALVDGLYYFLDLTKGLQPEFYDFKVQSLAEHLDWYVEKYPSRKKYLYHDEDLLAQKAITIGRKICEIVQNYSKERNRLLLIKADFDRVFNDAGEVRRTVLDKLNKLEDLKNKNKEINLPELSELIANIEHNFHQTELTTLQQQYDLFQAGKLEDGFYRVRWHETIPSLHRYTTNGLRLLEAEFNKFREIWDYSPRKLLTAISEINKKAELSNLPPVLYESVSQYGEILTILANERILLENTTKEMELAVKEFASNVFDETNLDE